MKTSIFLTSFFSMNCSGSKPFTSAAICVANAPTSNLVIRVTPLVPAASADQFALVPMPSDDTSPMPVMTTRLLNIPPHPRRRPARAGGPGMLRLALGVPLDVVDGFLDPGDLLGILVWDLNAELFLERHDQLHGVERIRSEIVHERCVRRHFFLVDAQLFDDDALHLVCNC